MKKCKYCQTEIDSKAKICPNCKKKQGPHIVRWILLGIVAIIIISAIAGGGEEDKRQKDFKQSEIATYEKINYSIVKVEKNQGSNEFCKPTDGKEYVKVTVKIENKSDKKISYSALDWQMVNADGVEDAWGTITGVLVWNKKLMTKI